MQVAPDAIAGIPALRDNAYVMGRQGNYIQAWRLFRSLSQDQLGERIGRTGATISRLENGKSHYTQQLLESIAAELDCGVVDLLVINPLDENDAEFRDIYDRLPAHLRRQGRRLLKALAEDESAA